MPFAVTDVERESWWDIFIMVVPCFNQQAEILNYQTATRRVIILNIGLIVMLATNFYQTFLLNAFMVQDVGSGTLSSDELAQRIGRNELQVVFKRPKQVIEEILGRRNRDYSVISK